MGCQGISSWMHGPHPSAEKDNSHQEVAGNNECMSGRECMRGILAFDARGFFRVRCLSCDCECKQVAVSGFLRRPRRPRSLRWSLPSPTRVGVDDGVAGELSSSLATPATGSVVCIVGFSICFRRHHPLRPPISHLCVIQSAKV